MDLLDMHGGPTRTGGHDSQGTYREVVTIKGAYFPMGTIEVGWLWGIRDAVGSGGFREPVDVLLHPGAQMGERRAGVLAERGQAVLDAGRHLRVDLSVDQAVVLQAAQCLGEDLGAHALQPTAQRSEALRPFLQGAQCE